ncbi:MAG: DUF4430 domain-containing protein [Clostridia bacterium]|nr:DUF4430 domain-containing protein [Clostridia bacterium]
MKKTLPLLSLLLTLALTLCFTACAPQQPQSTDSDTLAKAVTITVDVVGSDGNTTTFTIETSHKYLRGALEQENLVTGDESTYGLYIKTVNGELADYNVNGAYWAVYEGDTQAMTGVDEIELTDGGHYKLVYTK